MEALFDVFCHCAELNPDPNAGKLWSYTWYLEVRTVLSQINVFIFPELNGENGWFHGDDMVDGGWVHGDEDMVDGKHCVYFLC